MELFDYQRSLSRKTLAKMADHRAVMMQLGTGGGKTHICGDIVRRCNQGKNYQTLFLAHREELIFQAYLKFKKYFGVESGIIMGNHPINYSHLSQIASVQTIVNRPLPKDIRVVIIDEAHHATASTYREIINRCPDAKILGVTGTPSRLDGEGFDNFEALVCGPQQRDIERYGTIVPPKITAFPIDTKKIDQLKVNKKGEFIDKYVFELMATNEITDKVIYTWKQCAYDQQTLVFAVNLRHAEILMKAFRTSGIDSYMIGSTKELNAIRAPLIKKFTERRFPVLINVGIATEGTDIPGVEAIQMVRPSNSLTFFLQTAGRGVRASPGKKFYNYIDHGNLIFQHGSPNDDRYWSLEGMRGSGRDRNSVFRKFFSPLLGRELRKSDLPNIKESLYLEPVREDFLIEEFDALLNYSLRNGRKPYFAFKRFEESIKKHQGRHPNLRELRYIAGRLNYQPGWVRKTVEKYQ